jgi:hypothetical protein
MTRHFDVVSERLRDDYDGAYTLTISAASDCDGVRRLPDEARRREYIATVTRNGAHLAVTLSGADFLVSNGRGNSFTGQLFTYERINFKISDATWDEYGLFESGSFDIAERVSESTVVFSGSAAVQKTGAGFSGTFGGTIAASGNAVPPFAPFTATCESSHTFEMVRR